MRSRRNGVVSISGLRALIYFLPYLMLQEVHITARIAIAASKATSIMAIC